MVLLMCIADNSKLQTPQPLFGGYAPATCPGIGVRAPGLMEKLRNDPGSIDLDFSKIIEEGSIGGQWEIEFMGRSIRPYEAGDIMTFGFSAGGAGYGDPLEADPKGILEDLLNGLISEWTATNVYKVAYDLKGRKVDLEETKRLRDAERQARLERGRSWDDFHADWSEKKPADEILTLFGSWPEGQPVAPVIRM